MRYTDLNELFSKSSSARRFYLSQSVLMQIELSKCGELIHSLQDLHEYVQKIKKYNTSVEISKMLEGNLFFDKL
ncbi:MAG: hypothetical protein IJZ93_07170 [Clostridia bacterium]|nr:hypothetical protein [Clostridia bacterium]